MTLRWRLTLLYVTATAKILAATFIIAELAYLQGSTYLADRQLMRAIAEVTEILESQSPFDEEALRNQLEGFSDGHDALFLSVLGAKREIIYQSDPHLAALIPKARPVGSDRATLSTVALPKRGRLRLASISIASVGKGLELEMASPLPPSFPFLTRGLAYAFIPLVLLIVTLGIAGWVIAGRALAPIARIAGVAETVSRGALRERIPRHAQNDELARLIDVLNGMLDRIESTAQKLRQFTSNVSHQLKTPLTILRGEIEVALRGTPNSKELRSVLQSNLAELEKLTKLIEDMLSYSKMENESGQAPRLERLDQLLGAIAGKAAVLSGPKSQRIETELQPVSALIDPLRLEQAILNVVDNAVRHTPAGGRIALGVRQARGFAEITVQDSGPGVNPEEIPRLFERGHSRSGTGIGLGLARLLVESLSGTMEISSAARQGLLVRILLPLAQKPKPDPSKSSGPVHDNFRRGP